MRLLYYSLTLYLSTLTQPTAADPIADPAPAKESSEPQQPCTVRSPTSGAFFDLNPLHIQDPSLSQSKHPRDYSWNTTGWGLPYNFTMNFCGPVVEELDDVMGVEKGQWRNVSAYYTAGGKTYSIGMENSYPVFHGRKLVLNYTGGSPCDLEDVRESYSLADLQEREIIDDGGRKTPKDDDDEGDDDDDDDDEDDDDDDENRDRPSKKPSSKIIRRKSTIISLLCDRDPLSPTLTLSFVASSPDACTYFFEARSSAACAGIETAKQTLSPSGVFGVIALIAFIVYIVGGCVYSRVVLQQRGWRQLPNYALWSGIFGFFKVRR